MFCLIGLIPLNLVYTLNKYSSKASLRSPYKIFRRKLPWFKSPVIIMAKCMYCTCNVFTVYVHVIYYINYVIQSSTYWFVKINQVQLYYSTGKPRLGWIVYFYISSFSCYTILIYYILRHFFSKRMIAPFTCMYHHDHMSFTKKKKKEKKAMPGQHD